MIRWYLVAILILAAGGVAAFYLHAETGYVLINYREWMVETSLMGLVAAVIIGLFVLYWGLRLLIGTLRLPVTLRKRIEQHRANKARDSFEAGLLKLLEGNWKRAEVELVRRAADHHAGHLNYLAAARAAQRLGAAERRDHYLRLATQASPGLEFATLLTQAELQRERGEYAQARDTALSLRKHDPRHPYAIELLAESYAALGAWTELRELLLDPEAPGALPAARAQELTVRALRELIAQAVRSADLNEVKALWSAAPPAVRTDPVLRRDYARALARLNAHADAIAVASAVLAREWDPELAALYGGLHANEPLTQLANVEQWLNQHGEKPELLVTAGRACLRNKLWGKARSYLEAVTRVAPSPAAYLELARLCEQTQNREEADKFYRQGLELAATP
ncbi:MAG TPA: heme biosynthesis HemY N-terminal domain-containing protein [Solimonas sp.]|nr:heme biosynthesis HemY N-terminal domain-containing protein [Solimonas sp.]